MERQCRSLFHCLASNAVAFMMFANYSLRAGVALPHLESDATGDEGKNVARGDADGGVPLDDRAAERAATLRLAQRVLKYSEEHKDSPSSPTPCPDALPNPIPDPISTPPRPLP